MCIQKLGQREGAPAVTARSTGRFVDAGADPGGRNLRHISLFHTCPRAKRALHNTGRHPWLHGLLTLNPLHRFGFADRCYTIVLFTQQRSSEKKKRPPALPEGALLRDVERRGVEPLTSTMPLSRSTN